MPNIPHAAKKPQQPGMRRVEHLTGRKKGGVPAHKRSEKTAQMIRLLTIAGYGVERAATACGMAVATLRKYYGDDLARARSECDAETIASLSANIRGLDTTAIIFYLKARLGWRDKNNEAGVAAGAVSINSPQVIIMIPDNGRDPHLRDLKTELARGYRASGKAALP